MVSVEGVGVAVPCSAAASPPTVGAESAVAVASAVGVGVDSSAATTELTVVPSSRTVTARSWIRSP